ncbi:hypothetical protein [Lacunimicrobium album]
MNRTVTRSRIAPDGTVTLQFPVQNAGEEVVITVQSAVAPRIEMSQEEWSARVARLAGKWQGDFEVVDEGDYEQREQL